MKTIASILIFLLINFSRSFSQTTAPHEIFVDGIKSGDSISTYFLQNHFRVKCYNKRFKVVEFTFAFGDGNCVGGYGLYQGVHCKGDTLTDKAKNLLPYFRIGMPIFITDVKVANTNGQVYYPKEIWFRVKQTSMTY